MKFYKRIWHNIAKIFSKKIMAFPSPAADYLEERIDLNELLIAHPSATFFFKVETTAMLGDNIVPGSLAIIDRALKPRDNDIVVVNVNGELIMRRLEKKLGKNVLTASNEKFDNLTAEEHHQFFGVVAAVIHNPNSINHVRLG